MSSTETSIITANVCQKIVDFEFVVSSQESVIAKRQNVNQNSKMIFLGNYF